MTTTEESDGMKADERACPFCAETIKRAAIRCRWCGSDVPAQPLAGEPSAAEPVVEAPVEAPVETAVEPAAAPVVVAPAAETVDRSFGPSWLAGPLVTLALAVALVVAVVALVLVVRHDDSGPAADQLVSPGARAALLDQASRSTQKALSYQAASFDADRTAAGRLMTSSMRSQYDKTMSGVRDRVRKRGLVLRATVRASAIVSATTEKAQVLEFVNQTTTAAGVKTRQLDQNRLLVTMQRSADGSWLISELKAF